LINVLARSTIAKALGSGERNLVAKFPNQRFCSKNRLAQIRTSPGLNLQETLESIVLYHGCNHTAGDCQLHARLQQFAGTVLRNDLIGFVKVNTQFLMKFFKLEKIPNLNIKGLKIPYCLINSNKIYLRLKIMKILMISN
jgi:hypothetical protein